MAELFQQLSVCRLTLFSTESGSTLSGSILDAALNHFSALEEKMTSFCFSLVASVFQVRGARKIHFGSAILSK